MSVFDVLDESSEQESRGRRIYGVVIGLVTNNKDPEKLGRVKVKFPWLSDVDESGWARIAAPMAGKQRGLFFLPEVDDEVLVAFEHGDPCFPYVLGAMWNGKDAPPVTNDDGENNVRMIKSRSGHTVKLNDEDGKETIEIIDMSKKNSIVIDTSRKTITVTTDKDITLSAAKGTIKLDAQSVEISSTGATKLKAGGAMNVEASATMTVKGSTVNIN
jgi:uncharacterized protein involved in type VI secretion and phage assembly